MAPDAASVLGDIMLVYLYPIYQTVITSGPFGLIIDQVESWAYEVLDFDYVKEYHVSELPEIEVCATCPPSDCTGW